MNPYEMSDIQKVSTFLDIKRNLPSIPTRFKDLLMKKIYEEFELQKCDFNVLVTMNEDSCLEKYEKMKQRSYTTWVVPPVTHCIECGNELGECIF